MEIGAAASIATFVDLSVKVASLCINYAKNVKGARGEIARLQTKVEELEKLAKDVQQLLNGDQGEALSTSHKLEQAVLDCYTQIESVQKKLDPGKGRKLISSLGLRALKWPFESGEVDKIIADLEKCNTNISLALQIDQTRTILDIHKKIDLEKIPSARGAAFDSYIDTDELDARCHPETRKDLLHQVRKWAKDPQGKCIFWLNGVAGTGKSTISRTVAQSFDDDGQLGASFFFKRGESDRENTSKLFTTIAAQLLRRIPGLIPHIRSAIDKEPDIATKSLQKQFESLVFQPLEKLDPVSRSLVLVIDALDECEGDHSIRQVLHFLARMQELKKTVQVRIFVTSRPELPIRLGFDHMSPGTHESMILQDVPPATIEHDISVFLKAEFSKIKFDFNLNFKYSPESQISSDWPGDENIQKLTKMAIPLFIFAATVCRFVGDTSDWNPKQRLATILKYGTTGEASQLDRTYLPVLKQFEIGRSEPQLKRFGQYFRDIIGTIVILADPLSTSSLASLLDIDKSEIDSKLHRLHSVLNVPSDPSLPVRLLHLSFREFLVDPDKRDGDFWFWIDEKNNHAMIAEKCLAILNTSIKENICSLEHPGMPKRELSSAEIDECLPVHIRYACRYWPYHLERSGKRIFDKDAIHTFLCDHFLHWLEALSIIGKISDSISLIDTLRFLTDGPEVSRFLYDARRFLLQNRWIINEAPLQLYSSAIIFSPETSIFRTMFRDYVPKWIDRLPKTPKFWGAELQKLEGHDERVCAVAFSPDGKQLASGSDDCTVRLWDAATGEQVKIFKGHSDRVLAVAFSPSGRQLASGSADGTIRLWDAIGEQVKILEEYSNQVWAVAFSPDGKQLASASSDSTVKLWNVITGEEVKTLKGHSKQVWAVVFSSDGRQLASGSNDTTVKLWNVAIGESVKTLKHSRHVRAVAFSPDGSQLASGSSDNTVRLWDAATGEQVKTLQGHSGWILAVIFSPDGRQLASGSGDNTIRLWDAAAGEQVKTLEGHSGWVLTVAFSPDGRQLASGSGDNTVRLWDAVIGEQVETLEEHSDRVQTVVFSPNGRQLASGSSDNTVRLWDAATGEQVKTLKGHSDWVLAVAFSPDGRRLASASDDGTVRLWDVTTGEQVKNFKEHSERVRMIAFSPDSRQLASVSSDNTVKLWDAATENQVKILKGHSNQVWAVIFSPDGRQLASGSGDNTIRLWDAATGEQVKTLEGHSDWVFAIAFSPDGRQLASGSVDSTIRLWDVATGKQVKTLKGHSGWVLAVAFSPDGRQLASASDDGTVRFWDAATGEQMETLKPQAVISSLHFSSDSERLETDRGVIAIPPGIRPLPQNPSDHIFLSGEWITRDSQNLLWLPHNYRGSCSVLNGKLLVIGQESGAVSFFRFV